jgi:hypothetical protein
MRRFYIRFVYSVTFVCGCQRRGYYPDPWIGGECQKKRNSSGDSHLRVDASRCAAMLFPRNDEGWGEIRGACRRIHGLWYYYDEICITTYLTGALNALP